MTVRTSLQDSVQFCSFLAESDTIWQACFENLGLSDLVFNAGCCPPASATTAASRNPYHPSKALQTKTPQK